MLSVLLITLLSLGIVNTIYAQSDTPQWKVQSIDTMKFSRDLAREKAHDASFSAVIEDQVQKVAENGATHVAIGTPYDKEFTPFLKKWVQAARKNDINVWFRGNMSGWEGWFDHKKLTRTEHTQAIKKFIEENGDLFENGDIFTSCPECENGGPGDPRKTRDVAAYRRFLINEHTVSQNAFEKIGKNVITNYYSMNGDVARLIMDRKTTQALGGVVVIDHYVKSPDQLEKDINEIAQASGGKIVLGEFGAPIPDIHGRMTAQEQSAWLSEVLQRLSWNKNIVGLNYWAFSGSSTGLWNVYGQPLEGSEVLKRFYSSSVIKGKTVDEANNPIGGIRVKAMGREVVTDDVGEFYLPFLPKGEKITFESKSFNSQTLLSSGNQNELKVTLLRDRETTLLEKIKLFFNNLF